MRKITAVEHVSLDGVMQAPGRPDEDPRDGFRYGGWAAVSHGDPVIGREMAQGMGATDLLFGRRTYQDFCSFWPHQTDNPYTDVLNRARKYVASGTLTEPLPWQNSTLLDGDAGPAVAKLKQEPGRNLVVLGSGDLLQTLRRHHLIDEYLLVIHPVVLGTGRRLFRDGGYERLSLVRSATGDTGVTVATFRVADDA